MVNFASLSGSRRQPSVQCCRLISDFLSSEDGVSGKRSVLLYADKEKLEFFVHPIGSIYKKRPGLYAFAAQYAQTRYSILYVGQTTDLDDRVGTNVMHHEKYEAALRLGADVLLIRLFVGPDQARIAAEAALRRIYDPPLNQ